MGFEFFTIKTQLTFLLLLRAAIAKTLVYLLYNHIFPLIVRLVG